MTAKYKTQTISEINTFNVNDDIYNGSPLEFYIRKLLIGYNFILILEIIV